MRQNPTDFERCLWNHLRRRQLSGFKFRRQHQVGLYICDFVCIAAKVVIELDGSHHVDQSAYDARRDRFLRSAGFCVLRFWNSDVKNGTEDVLEAILRALTRASDPSAPPGHLPI